ncbi:MAG: hypothetical protein M3401_06185, partial [Actinomycetota bacterium]|nr:hypothetical protein [Actinomycetota bacterium]
AAVCAAALTAGGAAEVRHQMSKPAHATPSAKSSAAAAPQHATRYKRDAVFPAAGATSAAAIAAHRHRAASTVSADKARAGAGGLAGPVTFGEPEDPRPVDTTTGGAAAPDEETGFGYGVESLTPNPEPAVTSGSEETTTPQQGLHPVMPDLVAGTGSSPSGPPG